MAFKRSEKVPAATRPFYATLVGLMDRVCEQYLNDERDGTRETGNKAFDDRNQSRYILSIIPGTRYDLFDPLENDI